MNNQGRQEFLIALGNRVRQLRCEKEMSLDELARKCGYTSENARSSIQKIEAGKTDLPTSKIKAIADALETTPGYIMGWDEMDESANTEKISAEAAMWDFIGQRYGERTAAQLNDLLQLKPAEQERIWKLLEGYSKLDNEDRIVLLARAYQILEDMLAAEKYSKQDGGKAV